MPIIIIYGNNFVWLTRLRKQILFSLKKYPFLLIWINKYLNFLYNLTYKKFKFLTIGFAFCFLGYICFAKYILYLRIEHTVIINEIKFVFLIFNILLLIRLIHNFCINFGNLLLMESFDGGDGFNKSNFSFITKNTHHHNHQHNYHSPSPEWIKKMSLHRGIGLGVAVTTIFLGFGSLYYYKSAADAQWEQVLGMKRSQAQWEVDRGMMTLEEFRKRFP